MLTAQSLLRGTPLLARGSRPTIPAFTDSQSDCNRPGAENIGSAPTKPGRDILKPSLLVRPQHDACSRDLTGIVGGDRRRPVRYGVRGIPAPTTPDGRGSCGCVDATWMLGFPADPGSALPAGAICFRPAGLTRDRGHASSIICHCDRVRTDVARGRRAGSQWAAGFSGSKGPQPVMVSSTGALIWRYLRRSIAFRTIFVFTDLALLAQGTDNLIGRAGLHRMGGRNAHDRTNTRYAYEWRAQRPRTSCLYARAHSLPIQSCAICRDLCCDPSNVVGDPAFRDVLDPECVQDMDQDP